MVDLNLDRRDVLRATGVGVAGLAALGPSSGYVGPGGAASPTANVGRTAGGVDDGDVLIIKDCEPWNVPASEIALSELGIPYEVSSMDEALDSFPGEAAAGEYGAVVLPSSQPTEYYISLGELRPRLDAFVEAGGVLLAHMGNRGQPCNSVMDMPLEVRSDFSRYESWQSSGDDAAESLQEITVSAPEHEVMRQFSDADLSSWSSAFTSFGEITDLPSDATVLASLAASRDAATFVEYPKGDGRVLATMQIMEWPYGEGEQFGGTEAFLRTVLEYAVDDLPDVPSAEIVTDPPEPTVRTPVTLQVTDPDPREADHTYRWEVSSAPTDDPPPLLDEKVEGSRPDRSTVLTPPEAGTYRVEVTVEDDEGVVGRGFTTVAVTADTFTDWQVSEAFVSDDNGATPSFDPSRFEEADSAAELAEKYAPMINFHADETYYPTRYEAYFENANIEINDRSETIAERVTAIDIGNADLQAGYDPAAEDNYLYLRGDRTAFERYQQRYPRAVYASVTGTTVPGGTPPLAPNNDTSYIALTYWCFYLFDPKSDIGLIEGVQNPPEYLKHHFSEHTSDTETFTILFSESGPEWIGGAQHYSGEFMRFEKVVSEESHIEIYPAKGSHSTYFVNTERYAGGVPAQLRHAPESITTQEIRNRELYDVSDSALIPPLGHLMTDDTGVSETWTNDGVGTTRGYELLMLSGDSSVSAFNGVFVSDEDDDEPLDDLVVDEGGKLPQARGDRWNDPGPWTFERKLRETEILSARGRLTNLRPFSLDTTITSGPAEISGTVFNNGVKPHPFVVEVSVSRADSGERVLERSRVVLLPANKSPPEYLPPEARLLPANLYRDRKDLTIPLEDVPEPEREHEIEIDFRTYPSSIGVSQDRLDHTVHTSAIAPAVSVTIDRTTSVPRIEPVGHGSIGGDVQGYANVTADETFMPGESVTQEVTITNTGPERHTFLLELRAVGPNDVSFGGDETTETATLDPDETRTVELSAAVPATVPEGSYDLTTIVWLESDTDERFTKLDEETDENAIFVEKPVHELTIESTPPDAEIYMNEEQLGRTPTTVDRQVGRYDVLASKEGYLSAFERIVHEDGETTVTIELDPDPESETESEPSDDENGELTQGFAGVPLETIAAGGAVTAGLAYLSVRLLSNTDD